MFIITTGMITIAVGGTGTITIGVIGTITIETTGAIDTKTVVQPKLTPTAEGHQLLVGMSPTQGLSMLQRACPWGSTHILLPYFSPSFQYRLQLTQIFRCEKILSGFEQAGEV